MNYITVTITTTQQGLETVYAVLDNLGITQVSIVDDAEEIKRDLAAQAKYWDYADVEELLVGHEGPAVQAWLSDDEDGEAQLDAIRKALKELSAMDLGLDLGSLACHTNKQADSEWIDEWKKYFRPVAVGERFCILPTWEEMPEEWADRIPLKLHNGNIFGTGQHQTSQLCLELMEKTVHEGDRVLDLGCGSGILTIGAIHLGAASAVAVDVDSKARTIVPEHMEVNSQDPALCAVYIGDAVEDEELRGQIGTDYDMVMVNIVADVILGIIPTLPGYLKSEGYAVFSGIIEAREQEVRDALAAYGFEVLERRNKQDWVGLLARGPKK